MPNDLVHDPIPTELPPAPAAPLQQVRGGYVTAIAVQKPRTLPTVQRRLEEEATLAGESFYYGWAAGGASFQTPSPSTVRRGHPASTGTRACSPGSSGGSDSIRASSTTRPAVVQGDGGQGGGATIAPVGLSHASVALPHGGPHFEGTAAAGRRGPRFRPGEVQSGSKCQCLRLPESNSR